MTAHIKSALIPSLKAQDIDSRGLALVSDYLTEQEQVEILKKWVKQYSLVIIGGVLLAVIVISGWRYWQERQQKILTHASSVYDEMLTVRAQNDQAATLVQSKKLLSHYAKTPYGPLAALMLARDAAIKKNYQEAETQLQWVIDHSHVAALRQIARLRLARILIVLHKNEEALRVLNTVDNKTFIGLINEVKGDAYFFMNNKKLARDSYQQALSQIPNADVTRPLLQMKFDNLSIASQAE